MEKLILTLQNENFNSLFGGIMLLCQVLIAITILSMIAFACVDTPSQEEEEEKKEEKEKNQVEIDMGAAGEAVGHAVGCCVCGGGDGGDGGGCGGCGGD